MTIDVTGGDRMSIGVAMFAPARASGRASSAVRDLDRAAVELAASAQRMTIPLARAVRAALRGKLVEDAGLSLRRDFARERLGVSVRWLGDLEAIADGMDRQPRLEAALAGSDGGPRLQRVAAQLIARIPDPDVLAAWIAYARRVPVCELKQALRAAGGGKTSTLPPGAEEVLDPTPASTRLAIAAADVGPHAQVALETPPVLRAAFEEVCELHRAVTGAERSVTSFVAALCADARQHLAASSPGATPGADLAIEPLESGIPRAEIERALAESTRRWAEIDGDPVAEPTDSRALRALRVARRVLLRFHALEAALATARADDPAEVRLERVRDLLHLEHALVYRLGDVLRQLSDAGAWRELGVRGIGHYGEQRLGLSATTAEDAARLARGLDGRTDLKAAYALDAISRDAALRIVRLLDAHGDRSPELERRWAVHARTCTVRRVRDEARAVRRRALDLDSGATVPRPPAPLSDPEWLAGIVRSAGLARSRIAAAGVLALQAVEQGRVGGDRLRLRLPDDIAREFADVVETARTLLEYAPDDVTPFPSVRAARMFAARRARVPSWCGLLLMLELYVVEWDRSPELASGNTPVHERFGYRCAVPGCTARSDLHAHHIEFASAGGSNQPENKVPLCRGHHLHGVHEGRITVRGQAPDDLSWNVGVGTFARSYRNDRLTAAATAG